MAALPPLENMCGIASLSPAGKCSVAATSPSPKTLGEDAVEKISVLKKILFLSQI